MICPKDLPVGELAEALYTGVKGLLWYEAAVELLIENEGWLRRGDLRAYIAYWPAGTGDEDVDFPVAEIQWPQVTAAIQNGEFPASSGERQILMAACGLTGHGDWPLREALDSLGEANLTTVLQAIVHGRGWHETAFTGARIDGHVIIANAEDPECE